MIPTFKSGAFRNSASLKSTGFGCYETKFLSRSIESSSFGGLEQRVLNLFLLPQLWLLLVHDWQTLSLGRFLQSIDGLVARDHSERFPVQRIEGRRNVGEFADWCGLLKCPTTLLLLVNWAPRSPHWKEEAILNFLYWCLILRQLIKEYWFLKFSLWRESLSHKKTNIKLFH